MTSEKEKKEINQEAEEEQDRRFNKKLIWIFSIIAFLIIGHYIYFTFFPWTKFWCLIQEINIRTGQVKETRYLYFMKVSCKKAESVISETLTEPVIVSEIPEWQKVNILSPLHNNSPHFAFHGAFWQVYELERTNSYIELRKEKKFGIDEKKNIYKGLLESWQKSGNYFKGGDYINGIEKKYLPNQYKNKK